MEVNIQNYLLLSENPQFLHSFLIQSINFKKFNNNVTNFIIYNFTQ